MVEDLAGKSGWGWGGGWGEKVHRLTWGRVVWEGSDPERGGGGYAKSISHPETWRF